MLFGLVVGLLIIWGTYKYMTSGCNCTMCKPKAQHCKHCFRDDCKHVK